MCITTGKWTAGPKSPNAEKMTNLMHMYELTAANTLFEPRDVSELYTFLQTDRDGMPTHSDLGEYVGSKVKVKFKNKLIDGTVKATSNTGTDQVWQVSFDDGYSKKIHTRKLEKLLVHTVKKKIGRQLDYIHILVSTRWKSCVTNCKPKWGPSVHRDLRNDHSLVECKWS